MGKTLERARKREDVAVGSNKRWFITELVDKEKDPVTDLGTVFSLMSPCLDWTVIFSSSDFADLVYLFFWVFSSAQMTRDQ